MTSVETNRPKRWYDQDPLLTEVLDILKHYQEELKPQAQAFLDKMSDVVGPDTLEWYYQEMMEERKTHGYGNRWYDQDETLSKAVELLRIAPPATQREIAQNFLDGLKAQGLYPAPEEN